MQRRLAWLIDLLETFKALAATCLTRLLTGTSKLLQLVKQTIATTDNRYGSIQEHKPAIRKPFSRTKAYANKCFYYTAYYLSKPKNVISLITLILVAIYTVVTFRGYLVVRDQERQQLRSYVSAEPSAAPFPTPPLPIVAKIEILNTGATPAFFVRAEAVTKVVFPYDTSPSDIYDIGQTVNNLGTLFPQKKRVLTTGYPTPSSDDTEAVINGTKIVIVYGTISYREVFSKRFRFTDFCWYYSAVTATTGEATYCENHNDAN